MEEEHADQAQAFKAARRRACEEARIDAMNKMAVLRTASGKVDTIWLATSEEVASLKESAAAAVRARDEH